MVKFNSVQLTGNNLPSFRSRLTHGDDPGQTRGKEDSNMRDYEVVAIFQADLDEASLNANIEKIKTWITDAGGTIEKVDLWGKRRLAYPIRKQLDGIYVLVKAQMSPSFANELDRNLRFQEPVIRFMIAVIEK
jgi:small subunit ribosomal protein S6